MPSLRRTTSSPAVRSSPYSSALNGVQVARGHGHRRSSGSDTIGRRVLADIEWWRVTDGQCDPSAGDQGLEDHTTDDDQNGVGSPIAGVSFLNVDYGVDHLSWPPATPVSSTEASSALPTAEFAALSIVPRTPPSRACALENASASSSLESTPEPSFFATERLRFSDMDTMYFEDDFALTPLTFGLPSFPPALARAHTFADCFSLQDDYSSYGGPLLLAPSLVC
ncbi:hypothetical protein EST38_g5399 [Candolleomyces aberdarensis]|uniref:Uncharacterized protein n=1 Tax=Candolleomyces aberdarensis TaxID=2316362 RepID=A0A4Q2DNC0_9AGAR|nr:hypothetical protein EST38_g5399 [Candolleomyces aberdarensis]